MSYFNCSKSNIIIKDSKDYIEQTLPISNAETACELLEDIMLMDCFRIKGIGMLAIKSISIKQFEDTINFICYRIDTQQYY